MDYYKKLSRHAPIFVKIGETEAHCGQPWLAVCIWMVPPSVQVFIRANKHVEQKS
jgi:hypothetical protein